MNELGKNPVFLAFLLVVMLVVFWVAVGIIADAIESAMNTSEIVGFTDGLVTRISYDKGTGESHE
jgi:branched-subunit amino acid permease